MTEKAKSAYERLAAINVNDKIEKKHNLSYLPWSWAVDQLLRQDPTANWQYQEPVRWGDTVMVFCSVTAFGKTITAHLPVMNHKNQAIANPDAFAVNTAMQRCLAKGIALHGLGLYIYSSEDEPLDSESLDIEQLIETVKSSSTREEATKAYQAAMEKCVKAKDTAAAAKLKTAMKGWEPAKVAA